MSGSTVFFVVVTRDGTPIPRLRFELWSEAWSVAELLKSTGAAVQVQQQVLPLPEVKRGGGR